MRKLLHRNPGTQTPLHTFLHREFLTHRRLAYTKQVLQREPPTHRCFYTQKLLYGEVFFYAQKLTHRTKMPAYCKRFSNSCSSLTATGTRQRDPPTGPANGTTGQRDNGTTGPRDNRTTGQWDKGTTGQRDNRNWPTRHEFAKQRRCNSH